MPHRDPKPTSAKYSRGANLAREDRHCRFDARTTMVPKCEHALRASPGSNRVLRKRATARTALLVGRRPVLAGPRAPLGYCSNGLPSWDGGVQKTPRPGRRKAGRFLGRALTRALERHMGGDILWCCGRPGLVHPRDFAAVVVAPSNSLPARAMPSNPWKSLETATFGN